MNTETPSDASLATVIMEVFASLKHDVPCECRVCRMVVKARELDAQPAAPVTGIAGFTFERVKDAPHEDYIRIGKPGETPACITWSHGIVYELACALADAPPPAASETPSEADIALAEQWARENASGDVLRVLTEALLAYDPSKVGAVTAQRAPSEAGISEDAGFDAWWRREMAYLSSADRAFAKTAWCAALAFPRGVAGGG